MLEARQNSRGWLVPFGRRRRCGNPAARRRGMRGTLPAETFQAAAEINVTPMIDVMLVLLIIFMVVTPAMVPALPRAVHSDYQPDRHPTLTIDARGGLSLDVGGGRSGWRPGGCGRGWARCTRALPPTTSST